MALTMKQARIGIDATQQEIADKMGVHVQTYARMEKHPEDMTIKQAALFASIVGVPVSDILLILIKLEPCTGSAKKEG